MTTSSKPNIWTSSWLNIRMVALWALFITGCAGMERSCSSCNAENFGADWIVVQYKLDGTPLNCWKLSNTSIVNEPGSDGIFWQGSSGHLVHISGQYNRVQVVNRNYEGAAREIGIDNTRCMGGLYAAPRPVSSAKEPAVPEEKMRVVP